jgi:rRNA maturation endonuclease Nob1
MQAAAIAEGVGNFSEYGSQYKHLSVERAVKTAKAEQRLQMGLNPEDIDASKWKSVYQDSFVDVSKVTVPSSKAETEETLTRRKPAKKSSTSIKVVETIDAEDEGFVLIEKPDVSVVRSQMEAKSTQDRESAREKAKKGRDARELANNIFPVNESAVELSKSQFVTNYDKDFAWPKPETLPTPIESPSGIIAGFPVCSPPFALDSDPVIPPAASAPRVGNSVTKSEPALNLFALDSNPSVPTTVITPRLNTPYACEDTKFNALKDDKVGVANKPKVRSITPGIPCSEYLESFAWAAGASEAFKRRSVNVCRKKPPSNDSNGFVLGYEPLEEKAATAPAPKVDVKPATTAEQVKEVASHAPKAGSDRVFTVKDVTVRPSSGASSAGNRLWVNGANPPGAGYVGKSQFSNTTKPSTSTSTASKAIQKVKENIAAKNVIDTSGKISEIKKNKQYYNLIY